MRWVKRILRVLLVLAVLAGLGIGARALVLRKRAQLARAPRFATRPMTVRVAAARLGDLTETIGYLAVVEPIREAVISPRLTATVLKVLHDEGDRVKAGEVLVELDCKEIEDDIASVEAQIAQAQADLAANEATIKSLEDSVAYWRREAQRDRTLAARGTIPKAEAEATAEKANEFEGRLAAARKKSQSIRHLIESLKKRKEQLKTKLGYCTLRSPYSGVVRWRKVDPGDLAAPGTSLMVVADRTALKLAFDVPQQDLARVREGLPVVYEVNGRRREATLTHMFPSLNAARMVRSEVVLRGEAMRGLSCGQYVPVSVVVSRRKGVVLIPASALIEGPQGGEHVFVVETGQLEPRAVKVLGSNGDEVAVEGVKPGEQVVTNTFLGWARLAGGKKVEVIR